MPKIILTDITNIPSSANDLNQNFAIIEGAFLQVLSRVNPNSPNSMETDIDMNSKNIYNCKYLQAEDLRINGESFTDLMGDVHGAISGSEVIYNNTVVQANLAQAAADSIADIVIDMSDQVNAAATSASLAAGYAVESQNSFLNAQEAASTAAADAVASIDLSGYIPTTAIGVSVQGYNANTVIDASYVHTDVNYTVADAAVVAATSGSNTGDQDLSGYSLTSHNHSGVYEPADATILKDADIGSSVQAYNANLTTWAGKTAPSGTVIGTTDTQTLSAKSLSTLKVVSFQTAGTLTTTTGAVTADWSTNQNLKQNEPTGAITYTFTAPAGPCHLQLFIDSDGTSTAYTHIFPGTVIWMGATWAQVANKKAVINFWYDGTNYYAMGVNQV